MLQNLWKIGLLWLLPVTWDLATLYAWSVQGYHAAGGLVIRLSVPLAMPRFSGALRYTQTPRITEPSLETHRYQPHPPHMHFGSAPFLPHISMAVTVGVVLGWTILEWCFVMGLLRWGAHLSLASGPIRLRALPIYLAINLGLTALASIPATIAQSLLIRIGAGIVIPALVIGLQYFLIFLKFELLTDNSTVMEQWRHSQDHRRLRSSALLGWLVAIAAIGFLSALIANLGSGALWASAWIVIIDAIDVWLLVLLVQSFKDAKRGVHSSSPSDNLAPSLVPPR